MKLIILTFFFILSFKSASATLHPWTDLQGRTLQAAFVKSDGVTVTINWNGKVIPIPLSTLSADSQALAKRLSAPVTPSVSANPFDTISPPNSNKLHPWTDTGENIASCFCEIRFQFSHCKLAG